MLYMIVENFNDNAPEIYRRFRDRGRMMPEGITYVSSWIDRDFRKCFQLMETEDENLFDEWIANWKDIMDFEIFPVMTSVEAVEKIKSQL